MTFVTEVRKSVTDTAPVYAVVGATDLAVEKVRAARSRAVAAGAELADLDVAKVAEQVPARARTATRDLAGKAQSSYDALVTRGEELVKRLREQKATTDLVASANTTLSRSKGAVTTARNAAAETQRAAKATLTTGRNQTGKLAGTVVDVVSDDAIRIGEAVKTSTKATKPSVKRTATTARTRAAKTTSATKAATTSARKTAAGARKAAVKGADKVG